MQENNTQFRRAMNRTGLALALMLVLWQVVPTVLAALLNLFAPELAQAQLTQALLTTAACYLFAVPPAWLVLRTASAPEKPPETHDLTAGEFVAYVAICVGAMFVFNLVGNGLNALVSLLKGSESANLVNTVLDFDLPVLALMVSVFAPIAEEFIFRGLLWRYVGGQGKRVYVAASAVLFMLLHGNIVQYPYTFALGLIFALVYAKTGRLVYPIALHMAVNTIGGVVASVAINNLAAAAVLGWTYIGCTIATVVLYFRRRDLFTLGEEHKAPEHAVRDAARTPGMALAAALSLAMAAFVIIFV